MDRTFTTSRVSVDTVPYVNICLSTFLFAVPVCKSALVCMVESKGEWNVSSVYYCILKPDQIGIGERYKTSKLIKPKVVH